MVKQEMVRININILGISKLNQMGMGKFNSDDHYIYYCGQEFHRRNEVDLIINKRVQNTVLGCKPQNARMISVHFQGKLFNIIVIQVYAPTTDAKEVEVAQSYEDLEDLLELTHKNDMLFIIGRPWSLSGKVSACSAGDQGPSLGWEDPLEEGMASHSSTLAWRIPWTEETGGL